MRISNANRIVLVLAFVSILTGCKTPRWGCDSLQIRFEPAPSPPIQVEHRWSYALWWLIGWAPGGSETLDRYESDHHGIIHIRGIDPDLDQLLINDNRFIPFCISGPGNRRMTAWFYDDQAEKIQVIAEESDGVLTIPLQVREPE